VVNKGGFKLPRPKEGMCVDSVVEAAAEWVGAGRMAAPGEVQPAKGRCGSAVLALGPGGAQMQGGKIAMPELVRTLSMLLGRSVIDNTGFTDLFDLQLDFVPDDTTPVMPHQPSDSALPLCFFVPFCGLLFFLCHANQIAALSFDAPCRSFSGLPTYRSPSPFDNKPTRYSAEYLQKMSNDVNRRLRQRSRGGDPHN